METTAWGDDPWNDSTGTASKPTVAPKEVPNLLNDVTIATGKTDVLAGLEDDANWAEAVGPAWDDAAMEAADATWGGDTFVGIADEDRKEECQNGVSDKGPDVDSGHENGRRLGRQMSDSGTTVGAEDTAVVSAASKTRDTTTKHADPVDDGNSTRPSTSPSDASNTWVPHESPRTSFEEERSHGGTKTAGDRIQEGSSGLDRASRSDAAVEDDEFGDFASGSEADEQRPDVRVGTRSLSPPASQEPVRPSLKTTSSPSGISFTPDLTSLSQIYPLPPSSSARPPSPPSSPITASTSTARSWYRLTRPETLREFNSGADDSSYVRIGWRDSAVRTETLRLVGRWMAQDRLLGGGRGTAAVLARSGAGGLVDSVGAGMFGWGGVMPAGSGGNGTRARAGTVGRATDVDEERQTEKARERPVSMAVSAAAPTSHHSRKPSLRSPGATPAAQFSWSSAKPRADEWQNPKLPLPQQQQLLPARSNGGTSHDPVSFLGTTAPSAGPTRAGKQNVRRASMEESRKQARHASHTRASQSTSTAAPTGFSAFDSILQPTHATPSPVPQPSPSLIRAAVSPGPSTATKAIAPTSTAPTGLQSLTTTTATTTTTKESDDDWGEMVSSPAAEAPLPTASPLSAVSSSHPPIFSPQSPSCMESLPSADRTVFEDVMSPKSRVVGSGWKVKPPEPAADLNPPIDVKNNRRESSVSTGEVDVAYVMHVLEGLPDLRYMLA